ncbi:L,D-transpeptidase family protein [Sulfuritalea sp.]|uniref:L,D-transpeptidase family protein n=1 Tax=Sulfuritalea sp. TaxID=2480090 RepID=UPI001AC0E086|nr:L,D-transpeptidase family protein [Sulfuritalea sp.]MBN8476158.1 L,D-transpeptidase family protein [Sulfuritalea sp.]
MKRALRSRTVIAGCSLLLAGGLAFAAGKAPSHIKKNPAASAVEPRYTDSGPEPLLAQVFDAIEANRLDVAMQQSEMLVKAYPNFRLAHLVKGDLLLARARPLMAFGEGGGAEAGEKVADLRDEAIVRLKGYRSKPPANYVPRYLLQMHPEQKHAVVVDTQKSRLYLYQNDNGTPRFVADYYISQGKLGAEKFREGDKKTPIGVYHVTSSLPRQKLTDFYGSGAFPINYPNEWDKRQGRNGHGIWLHGTPSDTFSRPPKASDGCVVLANQDLDSLSKSLQVGLTPVIISNSIEWLSLDDWQTERTSLLQMIEEWRQDWESRSIEQYARHYSHKFNADGQGYREWVEHKRRVNAGKSWIKVVTGDISMFRNPGKEEYVVVTFEQDYRSSNLSNQMKKRQYWIKESGRWKIVFEGAV